MGEVYEPDVGKTEEDAYSSIGKEINLIKDAYP